jgi:hypothetical protein
LLGRLLLKTLVTDKKNVDHQFEIETGSTTYNFANLLGCTVKERKEADNGFFLTPPRMSRGIYYLLILVRLYV